MLKEKIKNYLSFGKRDRLGILMLLFLIGVIYLLPFVLAKKSGPFPFTPNDVLRSAMDSLTEKQRYSKPKTYRAQPKTFEEEQLFNFDPNTLTIEGWKKLGLNDRTIRTIDHYRTKGGRFRTRDDLKKIWGLPAAFFERVKDHVMIEVPTRQSQSG